MFSFPTHKHFTSRISIVSAQTEQSNHMQFVRNSMFFRRIFSSYFLPFASSIACVRRFQQLKKRKTFFFFFYAIYVHSISTIKRWHLIECTKAMRFYLKFDSVDFRIVWALAMRHEYIYLKKWRNRKRNWSFVVNLLAFISLSVIIKLLLFRHKFQHKNHIQFHPFNI